MKFYYLVILGAIISISDASPSRHRRLSEVIPSHPGILCPPAACPQDCGVQFFTDPQNGCRRCRCDPNDTSNPFGPQCPLNPCPADCSAEVMVIVNEKTGCSECKCQDGIENPTEGCESRGRCKNANGLCKKTCDADEERLKGKSACKGRRCKCCIKKKVAACTPGDRWTDKCNSCFCPPSGVPTCTLQDCNNGSQVNSSACINGQSFLKDCNECICIRGQAVCTEKACETGLFCPTVVCPVGCFQETDTSNSCPKCKCPPTITLPIIPPPDRCPQNPPCPADCTTEFIRNPQNGCITCRCSTSITQINPFATPPSVNSACPPTQCPADCTTKTIRDPNTGCQSCGCSISVIQINPFATPSPINACPSVHCPADCATETIRDPNTGCQSCQCSTSVTQINPFAPRPIVTACPPTQCPADCTTETIRDPNTGCQTCRCSTNGCPKNPPCPADCATEIVPNPQNGCLTCRCRTDITQFNPFAPPPAITACPPTRCPADCTTEIIRDPSSGCQSCRCSTSVTQNNPFAPPPSPVNNCQLPQCPANCITQINRHPITGCQTCTCAIGFNNINTFLSSFTG